MSEYRENEDLFIEEEATAEDTQADQETSADQEASADQGEEEVDYNPSSPDLSDNQIDEDIVTAVLLIKNKQGAVLPVTNLDNLKMERQANAHEVLRMCADVQDQISAIRVVGELAQIFQHLNQTSLKAVADMMNIKINGSDNG